MWVHWVPNKGVFGKAEWAPRRITQDLDNSGIPSIKIQVKIDQEPAMTNVQPAMKDLRPDNIIPINSPVGNQSAMGEWRTP